MSETEREDTSAQLIRLLSRVRSRAAAQRQALVLRGAEAAEVADPLANALDRAEVTIDLATDHIVELERTGALEAESWLIAEELQRDLGLGVGVGHA